MNELFYGTIVEGEVFAADLPRTLNYRAATSEWSYRPWGAVRLDAERIDLRRIESASGAPFLLDHRRSSAYTDDEPEEFHIGNVVSGSAADGVLNLVVECFDNPTGLKYYEAISKGERKGGSIGIGNDYETALEFTGRTLEDGRQEKGLVYVKTTLMEFSSVLVPQLDDTGVAMSSDELMYSVFSGVQISYEQKQLSSSESESESEPSSETRKGIVMDPAELLAERNRITEYAQSHDCGDLAFKFVSENPEGNYLQFLESLGSSVVDDSSGASPAPVGERERILSYGADNDAVEFAVQFTRDEPDGDYATFLERFTVHQRESGALSGDDGPEVPETGWAAGVLQKMHKEPFRDALATRLSEDRSYHMEFMAGYAAMGPRDVSDRRRAEHRASLEIAWSNRFMETERHQAFPDLLMAKGEDEPDNAVSWFMPTHDLVGGEDGENFALDSYSVRDILPTTIADDLYMSKVVARTPIVGRVDRRRFNAPTVRIPKETAKPTITKINLGLTEGSVQSAETGGLVATSQSLGHQDIQPHLIAMTVNIPNSILMLQGELARRRLEDSALEQLGSYLDDFVVKGLQSSAVTNATAIPAATLNATGVGSGEALVEALGGASKKVLDRNYRGLNGTYVSGTSLRLRLLSRSDGSGGGRRILDDGDNQQQEIDTVRGLGDLLWTTQLAAGGAANQDKEWQFYYGALRKYLLGMWVVTRMWVSRHDALETAVHMNGLVGGAMTAEDSGTKGTVTSAT